MMPADVELKWASGPKRSKAKQIPDDVWKRYESEIREMYTFMTLDELAAEMKRMHGFEATLRQYTARLERWGLKKYKTKNAALECMTEGSRDDTNLEDFSTANAKGSKRVRTAPTPDDSDTQEPKDSPSGIPSAKKPKMDHEQPALHQPHFSTLSENGKAPMDSDVDVFEYTIQNSSADILHDRQGGVLSEATVRSILSNCHFVCPSAFPDDVKLCLRIARSIQNIQQPDQGLELTFETENHLKAIAGYLSAKERFAEATHLFSIVYKSEQTLKSRGFGSGTPSLISAARTARSKEDCRFMLQILTATVDKHHGEMSSPREQFLVHILRANLSSRLGSDDPMWNDGLTSRLLASRPSDGRFYSIGQPLGLLVYVYYKWSHFLPSVTRAIAGSTITTAQIKSSVSHADFVQFYSRPCMNTLHEIEETLPALEDSLHWSFEATTWYLSAFQTDTKIYELGEFDRLWRLWHGWYTGSPKSPLWEKAEYFIGISLAEHLTICAKVIHILLEGPLEFYDSDYAVTLYLRTLYEKIDTLQKPVQSIETGWALISRQPAMVISLTDLKAHQMTSPKISNLVSTIAPSLGSADSSLGRLKEASKAIAIRRQGGGFHMSGTPLSMPGVDYSLYGSNPSTSFLSEVFARSCNISP